MPIDFAEWVSAVRSDFARDYKKGARTAAYGTWLGAWMTVNSRWTFGTNIFERDWDVLVVLDAMRVDILKEFSDQWPFLGDVGSILSVGSSSAEWIANTFTRDYLLDIGETAMVTSNANITKVIRNQDFPPNYTYVPVAWPKWNVVDIEEFNYVDEVWQYARDDTYGPVMPRVMSDRAIAVQRERSPRRLIIHYNQPHAPYIHKVLDGGTPEDWEIEGAHEKLAAGEITKEQILDAYRADTRVMLDEIEFLRRNLDADTMAITADHGEAFGELGAYEHPPGFLHPAVKRVPWIETDATDTGEYEPEIEPPESLVGGVDADLEEHLADMGYML